MEQFADIVTALSANIKTHVRNKIRCILAQSGYYL